MISAASLFSGCRSRAGESRCRRHRDPGGSRAESTSSFSHLHRKQPIAPSELQPYRPSEPSFVRILHIENQPCRTTLSNRRATARAAPTASSEIEAASLAAPIRPDAGDRRDDRPDHRRRFPPARRSPWRAGIPDRRQKRPSPPAPSITSFTEIRARARSTSRKNHSSGTMRVSLTPSRVARIAGGKSSAMVSRLATDT